MDKRELSQTVQATVAFTSPAYIRLLEAYVVRAKERFVADSPPIRNAQRRVDETRAEHEQAVAWMAEQGYEVTPSADASDYGRVGQVPLNKMRKIKVRKGAPTVEATPAPEQPAAAQGQAAIVIDEGDNFQKYLEAEAIRAATEEGLRVAGDAEAGWVYHHRTDYGEMVTLWVTDEPAPVEAEAPASPTSYETWAHTPDGERYVVGLRGGEVVAAAGPLHHSEVAQAMAGDFNSDPTLVDAIIDDYDNYTLALDGPTYATACALALTEEGCQALAEWESSPYADDSFVVTPPSPADAWEDGPLCTCGAAQGGYTGTGPHHYKNCRMYSQEGADQHARMYSREEMLQGAARSHQRMEWDAWHQECRDYEHNPYRG